MAKRAKGRGSGEDRLIARHFKPSEVIELALTAGFYAMVPRVLNALKVPIEEETLNAPVVSKPAA